MTSIAIIVLLGLVLLFFIKDIRGKKRNSKYFGWLWWIFEIEAIIYVVGAFILLLIISGSTALNHYFFSASRTERELKIVQAEIEEYYKSNFKYPDSVDQIISNNPLKRDWLTDNWDNPYRYTFESKFYEVRSSGVDGIFDNKDDLFISNK